MTPIEEAKDSYRKVKQEARDASQGFLDLTAKGDKINEQLDTINAEIEACEKKRMKLLTDSLTCSSPENSESRLENIHKQLAALRARERNLSDSLSILATHLKEVEKEDRTYQTVTVPGAFGKAQRAIADAMIEEIREAIGDKVKLVWGILSLQNGNYNNLMQMRLFPQPTPDEMRPFQERARYLIED